MPDPLSPVPKRHFRSPWIWQRGSEKTKNAYFHLRKSFSLDARPAKAQIFVCACTRYELFLNGQFVGRGPVPGQPYHQYFDGYEVADLLAPGENVLAVVVHFSGKYEDTLAGFLAELTVNDAPCLGTDGTWKLRRAVSWAAETHHIRFNQVAAWQEHFDARKWPIGWDRPGFDDHSWEQASVIPELARFTTLVPRDIPPMQETVVEPEAIAYVEECLDLANRHRSDDLSIVLSTPGLRAITHTRVEGLERLLAPGGGPALIQCSTRHLDGVFDGIHDPAFVLDFGRVITARPELVLEGPAGGMVDLGYAERLVDAHFNNAIECPFADRYVIRGASTDAAAASPSVERWQPMTWKGFRYLKVRFHSCFTPVHLHAVRAVLTRYPFEARGGFRADDGVLQKVFEASRETLRLCSSDSLVDTPWREQGQWLGDVAAVTLPGIHAAFGDTALTAKFVRQSAANLLPTGLIANMTNAVDLGYKHVIPDYSLWWIQAVWELYQFSGDAELLHDHYPHVLRILQAHAAHLNPQGLLEDMPYWVFIDWADVDKRGACCAYNALYYGTLAVAARMAELRGDHWVLEQVGKGRAALEKSFHQAFFDERRGVYVDAVADGKPSEKVSEHGNMAALRFGLAPAGIPERVVGHFFEARDVPFIEAQPFFTTVTLAALAAMGRTELALRLIRERWGERMIARGHASTVEEWYTNGSWRSGEFKGFFRSLSHAWSACPAEFLVRTLTGFEVVEPGCKSVRLAPAATDFAYEVSIPTPLGSIEIRHTPGAEALIQAPNAVKWVRKG